MLTLKLSNEDALIVIAALRMYSNVMIENISHQLAIQMTTQVTKQPEATVTVKRGPGRPRKNK